MKPVQILEEKITFGKEKGSYVYTLNVIGRPAVSIKVSSNYFKNHAITKLREHHRTYNCHRVINCLGLRVHQ